MIQPGDSRLKISIKTGIADYDMYGTTGTTGIGTIHYAEILIKHPDDENENIYFTWGLIEEINSRKGSKLLKPYLDRLKREMMDLELIDQLTLKLEKDKKSDEKKEKLTNSLCSEEVISLIEEMILNNAVIINQYRGGNEKAINSLIGQVIKISKSKNYEFDPVSITSEFNKKLRK